MHSMDLELMFVLLFVVATAVAIGARWLKVPYTVALVVTGLLLGTVKLGEAPHLTRELLFAIILPGLIFEAAFHLEFRRFWADRVAINSLATPGLLMSVALSALILAPATNALHVVEHFTLTHALVFGALISATDPIAVVGLFKALGAPKRLATIVEGESLVNDGTGVVVFTIALAFAAGQHVTLLSGAVEFVRIAGLGVLVGAAVGWAVAQVVVRIDEAMLELTLTMIAAYGSFALAEHFGVSGVMATVAAGMICGSYAARVGMSPTTRVAVETFWEYLAFALNSMVFLLIGLEVDLTSLLSSWQPILVAFAATLVGRFAVVFAVSALLRRTRSPVSWRESLVVSWAGLRGALSMVLVLSLPEGFENRALLVHMTFGVVLLSILTQGLSMGPLLKWLRFVGLRSEEQESWAVLRARTRAAQAAIIELERLTRTESPLSSISLEGLRAELLARRKLAEEGLSQLRKEKEWLDAEDLRAWKRRLLHAERQAVLEAQREGGLSEEGSGRLLADVDARLASLESIPLHPPEPAKVP